MADGGRSLFGRIGAALQGEVAVSELSIARIGSAGYDAMTASDLLRSELQGAGIDAWLASPAETSQLLCAWNAFALQSLADAFVAAETDGRGGAQRVSRVTAAQVDIFVQEVPPWAGRARRAASDPGYDAARDVPLPAPLPPWVQVEPCPRSHFVAMASGGQTMLGRLQGAAADVERTVGAEHRGQLAQLRGLVAELEALFGTGLVLPPPGASRGVHEALERRLRDGVGRGFVLGQILARPQLLSAAPAPYGGPSPYGGPPPYQGLYGHHHGHHHDDD